MGTSTNRNGLKPTIPLVPDWITADPLTEPDARDNPSDEASADAPEQDDSDAIGPDTHEVLPPEQASVNRFNQSLRGFGRLVGTTGTPRGATARVVKNYVSGAGGGSKVMALRMRRSSGALARLGGVLSGIQQNGLEQELTRLNLSQFKDRPAIEVLAALMDLICGEGAVLDDAITKHAYAHTIIRVEEENPQLDLDSLTQAQIVQVLAIFLEETIVYRLISDIGRSLTGGTCDVAHSLQIEEDLYQTVHGLVHASILPALDGALQDVQSLEQQMDTIYTIAFTSILDQ